MKLLVKISAISAAVVIAMSAFVFAQIDKASAASLSPASVSAVTAAAEQRSLYNAHCATCHGRDGKADTPKGRDLDADDLTTAHVKGMSDAKIARVIRNGKGDMPGFGKKLSAAQIAGLVRFVRAL